MSSECSSKFAFASVPSYQPVVKYRATFRLTTLHFSSVLNVVAIPSFLERWLLLALLLRFLFVYLDGIPLHLLCRFTFLYPAIKY